MWPAENALFVVVGARRIVAARAAAGRRPLVPQASAELDGAAAVALDAFTLPGTQPRGVLDMHVLVSDCWLRAVEVLWSDRLADDAQAEAQARRRLADAGFVVGESDLVRLDDPGFGQPRLAVAYPADLMAALRALAQRGGARLCSVLPVSVAAWQAHSNADALAIIEDDAVTLATGVKSRLQQIVTRSDGVSWQTQWSRMQLRDPKLTLAALPAVLDLTAGDDLGHSLALDLARAGSKRPGPLAAVSTRPRAVAAWLAAACVAMVALVLSLQGWQARNQLLHAQAALRALQQQPAAAAPAAPWTRQDLARVQSANAAIRELNLPIAALLAALQPPRDLRIAVLSVDASGSAMVRITAETRTAAEMARYAAFVASRSPFTEAYVTHHEIDAASAEKPYRFSLEASWRD